MMDEVGLPVNDHLGSVEEEFALNQKQMQCQSLIDNEKEEYFSKQDKTDFQVETTENVHQSCILDQANFYADEIEKMEAELE